MSLARTDGRDPSWPGAPPPQRDVHGRFLRGNAGKPVGARNRVSGRVARAILRDFEDHQDELLPRLRQWFLPQYLQLVGRLLPREADGEAALEVLGDLSDAELARLLADARAAMAREAAAAPTAPEAALPGARGVDGAP